MNSRLFFFLVLLVPIMGGLTFAAVKTVPLSEMLLIPNPSMPTPTTCRCLFSEKEHIFWGHTTEKGIPVGFTKYEINNLDKRTFLY